MYCKILKLSTGETIAGNIIEETSLYVDIMRPVKLIIIPKEKNSMSVMFTKWDHTVEYSLPMRVYKTAIVSVGEPPQDFKNSYIDIYNEFDDKKVDTLSFDDEDDIADDLSDELEEIVKKLSAVSNTENKTYH